MKNNKKGFTLLEILVVIGIIAVLVGMAFASYTTAQKKGRDAERKSELKAVQNCIEQYYSSRTTSPFTYDVFTSPLSGTINCGPSSTMSAPTDPIDSGSYSYIVGTSTSSSYYMYATLETGGTYPITNMQ